MSDEDARTIAAALGRIEGKLAGTDDRVKRIEANLDGALAIGRSHGEAIAGIVSSCSQRHKRDTDETKRFQQVADRVTALETTGVAKQATWLVVLKLSGLVVAAAGLAATLIRVVGVVGGK